MKWSRLKNLAAILDNYHLKSGLRKHPDFLMFPVFEGPLINDVTKLEEGSPRGYPIL